MKTVSGRGCKPSPLKGGNDMQLRMKTLGNLWKKYPDLKIAFHRAIDRTKEKLSGDAAFDLSHFSNIEIARAIDNEFYSGRITPEEWKTVLYYQRLVVSKIRGSSI